MATLNNVITNANGCVGIGTTSPTGTYGKLTVAGGIRTLDDNNSKLELGRYSAGASNSYIKLGTNSNALHFTNAADNADIFTILNGGNVGIGTTSPSSAASFNKVVEAYDATSLSYQVNSGGTYKAEFGISSNGGWLGTSTAHDMRFVSNGSEKMRITSGGNIGIGTSSPTQLLELRKTGGSAIALLNYNDSVKFNINASSGGAGYVGMVTNHDLIFVTNDTERVRLNTNGNLGIGTNGPTTKLAISDGTTVAQVNPYAGVAYFGTVNNYPMVLSVNSSEKVRITSDGKVGIGTSSPNNRLDVVGGTGTTFNMSNDGDSLRGGKLTFISSSATGRQFYVGTTSAIYNLVFGIDSVEKARIDTAGNLGIGTTSPAESLNVYGTNKNIRISNTAAYNASGTSNLGFDGIYNTSNDFAWFSRIVSGKENTTNNDFKGYLAIQTNSTVDGITERMRITSGGNVGIGTTSPSGILDIQSSNSGEQLVRNWNTSTSGTGKSILRIANSGNNNQGTQLQFTDSNYYVGTISSDRTNGMAFYVGQQATPLVSERMRIDISGNVGIGTTAPSYKFQVNGDQFGTSLKGGDLGAGSEVVRMIKYDNTYAMVVRGDGYVGIGTTSPAAKLDVTSATDTFSLINATNTAQGNRAALFMAARNVNGNVGNVSIEAISVNNQQNDMVFRTGATTMGGFGTERIRITSTGNIGINTADPDGTTLRIIPFSTDAVQRVLHIGYAGSMSTGINGSYISFGNGNPSSNQLARIASYYEGATYQGSLRFYTNSNTDGANPTERMRIDYGGNVGIGTTSPAYKLDVSGTGRVGDVFLITTATTSDARLEIGSGRSGNGNSYLDLIGDATYTDYGLRLIRYDSGANSNSRLEHRGTGQLQLFTTEASALVISTNSSERMRITSGGNVIIGNTTAYAGLTISDITANDTNDSLAFFYRGTSGNHESLIRFYDFRGQLNASFGNNLQDDGVGTQKADLVFKTAYNANPTERMRITNTGNVGIGTTSPTANLTVYNSSTPTIDFNTGTSTSRGRISATSSDFTLAALTSSPLIFKIDSGEKMRIAADGNIGIGTTSPAQKFSVIGNIYLPQGNYITWNNGDCEIAGVSGFHLTFRTYTGVTMTEKLRIQSDGNVGIGTTSPSHKLDVAGSARFTNIVYAAKGILSDSSGVNPVLEVYNTVATNATTAIIRQTTAGGNGNQDIGLLVDIQGAGDSDRIANFRYYDGSTYTSRMAILRSGNVGIGTQLPVYKLEVNGSLYATRLSGSAMFTTNGKGRFYGTASYALAAPAGSSLTGQTDSASPFETSLGYQAGNVNTGTGNTAIGYQALLNNTTGTGSIAIGYQALYTNTRGKRNIAIGYEALRTTQGSTDAYGGPIGDENVAIGYQAARAAFNINRVVAIGHRALAKNLAGGNVAIGWLAMESNVGQDNSNSGVLNTAVGTMALSSNTSGNANSAFGYLALTANTTGNENTAVGHRSMYNNTSGKNNCSFGSYALYYNDNANNNSAFGAFALYNNNTGGNNNAFGYMSLRFNTTGVNNCAFGSGSLYNNTSGTKNTAVGGNAGSTITTGTNLSLFGYNAQASTATATNQITLGNSSVATLRCQVTTITALSDFRDKTDINNVEVGLSFVEKLRPVTFKWDKREWYSDGNRDGSKKEEVTQIGFIAQELKSLQEAENATYLKLVLEDNPDKLEATPGNLLIPLIKAVQELNVIVKQQRIEFDDKIAKQQLEIDYLKSKLNN